MNLSWLFVYLLPTLGFLLALALLAHILRERRSPTSTLAWLMAIIFLPYVGVPLYLIFGERKMLRRSGTKPDLDRSRQHALNEGDTCDTPLIDSGSGLFPPCAQTRISFLTSGEQAFSAMLESIRGARHTIDIATFILGKGETGKAIVNALAESAARGVKVRLLLDALGSIKITRQFLAPLTTAGGRAAFFMPMLHLPFRGRANLRNHRKMVICDHQTAIIGGMNLASVYMGPQGTPNRWRDLSIAVQGPVIGHLAAVFNADWAFASKDPPADDRDGPPAIPAGAGGVAQLVASGPDVRGDSLRNAILTAIFRAQRRIWIVSPYFVPDELLLEALCLAVDRDIEVLVILPRKSNHRLADIVREGYLARLQEAGAGIRLYEKGMLHAKALLVDDTIGIVGSANMDMRSMLLNYEIALCLYDADTLGRLESWMLDIQKNCLDRQPQHRKISEFIESVGRLLAPLL